MSRKLETGDVVKHFKREICGTNVLEKEPNMYYYMIRRIATHTETGEKLVVYDALYAPFECYARPYDMFMSEVDREKYPDIKQQYRLEKIDDVNEVETIIKRYYDKFIN